MRFKKTIEIGAERDRLLKDLSRKTRLTETEILKRMIDELSGNASFIHSLYPQIPQRKGD